MDPIFYSTVVGKFKGVIPDGVDADQYPDLIVPSGTGTLTCSVKEIRISGPDPQIIVPQPIDITLDEEGNLVPMYGSDSPLMVIACNAFTNPSTFSWRLDMRFTYASRSFRYGPHEFIPVSGGISLLPEALTVSKDKGTLITRGAPGMSAYEMAVAQGKFTGTEQEFIDAFLENNGSTVSLAPDPNNEGFFIATQ